MILQELKIEQTKVTPEIYFNPGGAFFIKGRSIRANISEFSKPVEDWINEYIKDPPEITVINIELEYLNTNNLKFFIDLLTRTAFVKLKNKKVNVTWFYEEGDLDIHEKGESISSIVGMPFSYVSMKSI